MSDKHAVKLKVLYSDGSGEDYDVFIAAVADGLIVAGKDDDGSVLYAAGQGFTTWCMTHIAATPDVSVGLIKALQVMVQSMVDSLPPEIAPSFLEAMISLAGEKRQIYHNSKSIRLRGED